jgi:hypothetical protein
MAAHDRAVRRARPAGFLEASLLLRAFGGETANIHLGTPRARARILRELRRFDGAWLRRAAKRGVAAVMKDWRAWREG